MRLLKRLSNTLTRKRKQWGCLHHWQKDVLLDILYGKGFLYQFRCDVCEKKIARWSGYEPISGILPDPWALFKKDPQMNVSPPIIRIED